MLYTLCKSNTIILITGQNTESTTDENHEREKCVIS